jgi:very-short-patch-repair endonuclease
VRLDQLEALGLGRGGRRVRIAQRRLIVLYRGIYAVGHDDLTERGRFRAAVWAAGEGALLGDLAAARLLGLWERPVDRMTVVIPGGRRPRVPSVTVHRTTAIERWDRTHVRGIPCTSVSRLLVDLAATPALEAVFERAERRRAIRPDLLDRMVHNRPGAAALRALLATHRPKSRATRSLLERRLLAGLRRAGVAEPIVNGHLEIGGEIIEPDLMWPAHKVLVELDGGTHATPTAMRRDRRRDRRAIAAGWIPLRFTWDDLEQQLTAVLADITGAICGH